MVKVAEKSQWRQVFSNGGSISAASQSKYEQEFDKILTLTTS
jgi:hypothetical protein